MVVSFGGIAFDAKVFESMRVQWDPPHFLIKIQLNTAAGAESISVKSDKLDELVDTYLDILSQLPSVDGRPTSQGVLAKRRHEILSAFREMAAQREAVDRGRNVKDQDHSHGHDPSTLGQRPPGPSLNQLREEQMRREQAWTPPVNLDQAGEEVVKNEQQEGKAAAKASKKVRREDGA